MPLSGHNVGTYQKRSSNETRQGTLRHSRLGSLSHCGLILALRVELVRELISTLKRKRKRKAQAENELSNILPKSSHARKSHQRLHKGQSKTVLASLIRQV